MKEMDKLIDAALERILQCGKQDPFSPLAVNSSENDSQALDLQLWNQLPLVLIDESHPDQPIIDIFTTNRTGAGTQHNSSSPSPSNTTAEAKKYKVAMKLVRGASESYFRARWDTWGPSCTLQLPMGTRPGTKPGTGAHGDAPCMGVAYGALGRAALLAEPKVSLVRRPVQVGDAPS